MSIVKKQKQEDEAYEKLTGFGYSIEMSEAHVPIELRKYEVWTNREIIFAGNFKEFIKFARYQK